MSLTLITLILGLIEQVVPLLGASASSTTLIANIVATLENVLPLIINSIPTLYTTVKNIITALTADPSTTADQLKALQALDAAVDAAFDAAAAAVDPDALSNAQPTG